MIIYEITHNKDRIFTSALNFQFKIILTIQIQTFYQKFGKFTTNTNTSYPSQSFQFNRLFQIEALQTGGED